MGATEIHAYCYGYLSGAVGILFVWWMMHLARRGSGPT